MRALERDAIAAVFGRGSHLAADDPELVQRSLRNRNSGADDGARTRDIQDHNLALYQLSYDRREANVSTRLRARSQDPN